MEPHYALACRQDDDRMKLHTALQEGTEPDAAAAAARDFVLHGLLPAARARSGRVPSGSSARSTCSTTPDALDGRPGSARRPRPTAHAAKDQRPPRPVLGPPRDELLAVMATA